MAKPKYRVTKDANGELCVVGPGVTVWCESRREASDFKVVAEQAYAAGIAAMAGMFPEPDHMARTLAASVELEANKRK